MEKIWIITDTTASFAASDFCIPGREFGWDDAAYCRKMTLSGGRQAGVEIIEISNGLLTLRVCPTRGMGILDGRFGAHPLGWQSPVREIIHPHYIHLLEMGGRGCHYGFNEFLNRCGIEWSGAMGEDEIVNNMGSTDRIFLPLHGKVGWTPAGRVALRCQDERLILEGDIAEQMVFGVNYVLRTRLVLEQGSARIRIEDTLSNLGDTTGEYEMLYHTNFGPPFLEAGSQFLGTYDKLVPRDRFAADGLAELGAFPGPAPGFIEQVFLLQGCADVYGFAHQLLVNAAGNLAAKVSYQVVTLPYSILWKRCSGTRDGYVIGFNPCSDLPNPRQTEREGGRVARIQPGAEVHFAHWIELFEGAEAVSAVTAEIQRKRGQEQIGKAGDFAFFMK
jgi:hypothetical protein